MIYLWVSLQAPAAPDRSERFPMARHAPRWDGFSCGCEDEPHSTQHEEFDFQEKVDYPHLERRTRGLLQVVAEWCQSVTTFS